MVWQKFPSEYGHKLKYRQLLLLPVDPEHLRGRLILAVPVVLVIWDHLYHLSDLQDRFLLYIYTTYNYYRLLEQLMKHPNKFRYSQPEWSANLKVWQWFPSECEHKLKYRQLLWLPVVPENLRGRLILVIRDLPYHLLAP